MKKKKNNKMKIFAYFSPPGFLLVDVSFESVDARASHKRNLHDCMQQRDPAIHSHLSDIGIYIDTSNL